MSEMTPAESAERFVEGLKQAASCARELAVLLQFPMWLQVAIGIDQLRHNGMDIIKSNPLTEKEINELIEQVRTRAFGDPVKETVQ